MHLNKKTIGLILGVVLLLSGVGFGVFLVGQNQDFRERAAPASSITLNADNTVVSVGDTFTVSAVLDTSENQVVASELYFTFDPDVLEAVDAVAGDFFPNPEVVGPSINNETGRVDFVLFVLPGTDPQSGTGSLVDLTFRAKSLGNSIIALSPDSIVGATGEGAQNVLISTTPVEIAVTGVEGGVGGGDFSVSTPTPTPGDGLEGGDGGGSATSTSTPTPTGDVSSTPTATPTVVIPDELPDAGYSAPFIFGMVSGIALIILSAVMVLL